LKTGGEAVRGAPDDGVPTSAASVMGGTAEDVNDRGGDAASRNTRWRGALQGALTPAGWNLKKLGAIIPASHAEFADFIEILRKLHPVVGPQPHYSGEQITDDAIWWDDQYIIVRREGKLLKVNLA
jgi:hypothetical protein